MFQADRQAQEICRAARVRAFNRRAVLDEAVCAAQASGMAEQLESGDEFERFCLATLDLDGHHAAEAGHLRGGDFVSGMRRQAGIVHGFNFWLRAQEFGNAMGVFRMGTDAVRKGLKAA